MVLGKLDSCMQRNETGPVSYVTHKDKLKTHKRPKCETGIHQNPRGEHGSNLFNLGLSNFLQDTSLKVRETKAKMNFWDFIKIKSFCKAKETVNKTKRQPTEGEDICKWHKR